MRLATIILTCLILFGPTAFAGDLGPFGDATPVLDATKTAEFVNTFVLSCNALGADTVARVMLRQLAQVNLPSGSDTVAVNPGRYAGLFSLDGPSTIRNFYFLLSAEAINRRRPLAEQKPHMVAATIAGVSDTIASPVRRAKAIRRLNAILDQMTGDDFDLMDEE